MPLPDTDITYTHISATKGIPKRLKTITQLASAVLKMSIHKDALHLSLPEIGRSSSWRLLWAEPRTRCDWDWWAPVPLLPSRLWPKAGTKDSTAPTGSRPPRPAEPRGNLQMTGMERGSSTPQRSRPHPAGLGDPSEEPAYSLEVARSSGPAWHSQVWGGETKWQNRSNILKNAPVSASSR